MILKKIAAAFLLAVFTAPAFATNFSYTSLNIAVGQSTLEEPLLFEGDEYEDFAFFSVGGSYQLADNIALGLSASGISEEGRETEISSADVEIFAAFPFAVSEMIDIVPLFGYISNEVEFCFRGLCEKVDDSGMTYGLVVRAWTVADTLELNAGFAESTMEDTESTVTIGGAFWLDGNNSLGLHYTDAASGSTVAFSYRYSWQ